MTSGSDRSSDSWCTPEWLAAMLGEFDLDPCSNPHSHIRAHRSFQLERNEDGLSLLWVGSVFVNCPYSNVGPWAAKLADHNGPWCALVKLDPTTKWWATLMSANPQIAPFRKRLKFEGDKEMTANFPSVLVFKRWEPSRELAEHLWIARYV